MLPEGRKLLSTAESFLDILKSENFIGCASLQVDDFLNNVIRPLLEEHKALLGAEGHVRV